MSRQEPGSRRIFWSRLIRLCAFQPLSLVCIAPVRPVQPAGHAWNQTQKDLHVDQQ